MRERSAEQIKLDVDAAYNMQDSNNTQALGFDNLKSRSGAIDDSRTFESSHESVFDKLLADYYLARRGENAESNKLMGQLTDIFEKKMSERNEISRVLSKDRTANLSIYKLLED